ncbi:DUF6541 family protein [Pseudonocardia sp. KRD291]|uniref:DUF6541 family protein n=1 Tax=Pseudonocardia sp. KRD291 TaxID=2792007 RepID=UPI001C4A1255|nr:DUF6541 family protein [Pseudonocardia sp. KRD291]MBW0104476.1 hypothetical protein [Pseudonocardia sp. KRD291]
MSWLSAVPAVLSAGFWALGPGLLIAYAAGLRSLVAWGAAPLLSVAVSAVPAVLAGALGIPWGVWVPLVSSLLAAAAVLGVRELAARRRPGRAPGPWTTAHRRVRQAYVRARTPQGLFARVPDSVDGLSTMAVPQVWANAAQRERASAGRAPWLLGAAAAAGAAVAAVLGWFTAVNGMGPADALSQTYDAVFHYSAVAQILDTGNASSLHVGTLTNPALSSALYPAAWHDLVSLVALSTPGAGVVVATNATALAVAVVVWPVSCLFLVRQVAGSSIGAALATPVLAVGFTAFPWALMSFGVLWPNLLGVALLPGALAAVITLFGLARESSPGPAGAAALLVVDVPTLALAHPNAVFSLAALALFPTLWWLAVLVRRRLFTRSFALPLVAVAGTALVVWGVLWLMVASPLLAGVRSFDWAAFSEPGEAVWDVALGATNNRPESWTVSILVLVGIVFALRRASTSWLVPTHLLSGFLYVQSAAQETDFAAAVTGAWYNDSYRLAAMVPVTGVALAVVGTLGLAGLVRRAITARPVSSPRALPLSKAFPKALPAMLTAAVLVPAVAVSGGMGLGTHATVLAGPYQEPDSELLEPGQREFLERAGEMLPADAVVASNPFTGNVLLYPLTGREVLFPHMTGAWTPDQKTLAAHLRDVSTDPAVCPAVAATRTGYVLDGPTTFWPWNGASRSYPGLQDISPVPGFELMADDGVNALYRITACGPVEPTDS